MIGTGALSYVWPSRTRGLASRLWYPGEVTFLNGRPEPELVSFYCI